MNRAADALTPTLPRRQRSDGLPLPASGGTFWHFFTFFAIVATIMVLFFPAISLANEIPPGRWWHIAYFADQLKIDDHEKVQLDKLFDYNRNRLADLRKQMEEERNDLVKAIEQEHLNESSAIVRMKKLENTRTLLAATRFSYSIEVRKLLGYYRFQRLKVLYRTWPGLKGGIQR